MPRFGRHSGDWVGAAFYPEGTKLEQYRNQAAQNRGSVKSQAGKAAEISKLCHYYRVFGAESTNASQDGPGVGR